MAPRRRGLGWPLGCPPLRRGRGHRGPRRPPGCQHRRFGPGGRHLGPFRTAFRQLKTIPGVALGAAKVFRAETDGHSPTTRARKGSGGSRRFWACRPRRHRRIITGSPELPSRRVRLDAYRAALEKAGFSVDREVVGTGDFRVRSGYEQAKAFVRSELASYGDLCSE